jgi:hypothetical protein
MINEAILFHHHQQNYHGGPSDYEGERNSFFLLFLSMGREYVSKMRPPTGKLFIPHVTYEYGETVE